MFALVMNDESGLECRAATERLFREAAAVALTQENMPAGVEIGLTLLGDEAMRELNVSYRGIDTSTDVLSFPAFDEVELERLRSEPDSFPERPLLVGDIVISVPTARRQATEYGHRMERELAFLFVHGLLHLLGYDHDEESSERRMRQAEEFILAAIGAHR